MRDITVQVLCVDIVAVLDMITVMSWLQDTDTTQTQSAGLRTLCRVERWSHEDELLVNILASDIHLLQPTTECRLEVCAGVRSGQTRPTTKSTKNITATATAAAGEKRWETAAVC